MFADRGLGQAKALRGMNGDFGILPWPKFTEEDEHSTVINGHASLMLMPVTVEDPEKTGAIAEALCAIGSRDVIPAFYEVSLKTKFSRDAESEKMIDIIKNSLIYDLGYASGGTFQSVGHDLAGQNNPDFSSYYASHESAAINALQEFNKPAQVSFGTKGSVIGHLHHIEQPDIFIEDSSADIGSSDIKCNPFLHHESSLHWKRFPSERDHCDSPGCSVF
jgi:hypothetical protein